MNQTMYQQEAYQQTTNRALTQQATIDVTSSRPKPASGFNRQWGVLTSELGGQPIRDIPSLTKYSSIGSAHKAVQWQDGFFGEPERRTMTVGAPQSNAEAEDAFTRLTRRYTFVEREDVQKFLLNHPDLVETLLAAVPRIYEFFGYGTCISLQVLVDHDGEDDLSLFARIQTYLNVREALQMKKRLYREWWMKQPDVVRIPLTFDVECL